METFTDALPIVCNGFNREFLHGVTANGLYIPVYVASFKQEICENAFIFFR